MEDSILCLDFETTGIPSECGILEIGACWLSTPGEFERECRPPEDCLIEEEALKRNGYTKERAFDLGRMPEAQALGELFGFIRGGMPDREAKVQIAAWNAPFEMRLLRAAAQRCRANSIYWPFRHSVIDPQSILTADLIRGSVFQHDEFGADCIRANPALWGGLVKNSDHASDLLHLVQEPMPHRAINGARQVRAMLWSLGFNRQPIPNQTSPA